MIEQLRLQRQGPDRRGIVIADLRVQFQFAVSIPGIQPGAGEKVIEIDRGNGAQRNRTEDAAQPPHVLIFQIGTVAPLQDLDGDPVDPDLRQFGDVELGGVPAALAHPGQLAVDPDIEEGVHAVEFQQDPPFGPVVGDLELADIAPGGVFRGDERRIYRERVIDVGVMRMAVSFQLPVARDFDVVPLGAVEILPEKIFRDFAGRREIPEFPRPVQQSEIRGERRFAGQGIAAVIERNREGTVCLAVD